jgi:hypothetical protein
MSTVITTVNVMTHIMAWVDAVVELTAFTKNGTIEMMDWISQWFTRNVETKLECFCFE